VKEQEFGHNYFVSRKLSQFDKTSECIFLGLPEILVVKELIRRDIINLWKNKNKNLKRHSFILLRSKEGLAHKSSALKEERIFSF
jgi:hypothetical protein